MSYRNTISHPKCFNTITGKTLLNESHVSVQQSIRLICTTSKGELLGDPEFGSNLYSYVYDQNNKYSLDYIKEDLWNSIVKYEKRITLNDIVMDSNNTDYVSITIVYTLNENKETGEIVFTLLSSDEEG